MIERVCLRRRLASACYHPSSPLADGSWVEEQLAEQRVVVFSGAAPTQEDVCRHVASKQTPHGLPFFVMSLPSLLAAVQRWAKAMPRVKPLYSLRCNADPVLCQTLAEAGLGFEASSARLLETALDVLPAGDILYSNPCLTRKAFKHANEVEVGMITIESENDLLNAIAHASNTKLLIRVCMASFLRCYTEDVDTRFGCTFDEARQLMLSAFELRAKVIGISFHMGSGHPAPTLFYKAIRAARQLLDEGRAMGLPMDTVCLGGGFSTLDDAHFDQVADVINQSIDEYFPASTGIRLLATPGRFFATAAFSLCTTVIGKQAIQACEITNDDDDTGPGYIYQTNEGVYGSFICRLTDNCEPKCRPLDDLPHHDQLHHATVLGPNVDGTDVAQQQALLPQLSLGEWLLWDNMGAYSMPLDSDGPALPVYYYDTRKAWDGRFNPSLKRIDSEGGFSVCAMGSEGGSQPVSDAEEEEEDVDYDDDMEEDVEDVSRCLRRFFRNDMKHFYV